MDKHKQIYGLVSSYRNKYRKAITQHLMVRCCVAVAYEVKRKDWWNGNNYIAIFSMVDNIVTCILS